jgi:monoamine oxidase
MSGGNMFNKISRRKFIAAISLVTTGLVGGLWFVRRNKKTLSEKTVSGKILGASAQHGHLVRKAMTLSPVAVTETDIVIVGGGIAGLSAGRWLSKKSDRKLLLLELENSIGGNSASGKNKVSEFPFGAHYLPLPNKEMTELIDFLQETGSVTGFDTEGKPFYNETHLCFAPDERLYIGGYWQSGLVPKTGIGENDRKEMDRFHKLMQEFKWMKGSDGKFAFDIPLDNSSQNAELLALDQMTMKAYLEKESFTSEYLHWYINYCCRDDYGTDYSETSAWAGIHYFAARRNVSANSDTDTVLTWPEGNGWLAKQLSGQFKGEKKSGSVVTRIFNEDDKVIIDYYDISDDKLKRVKADKCIVSTPQFVNRHIVKHTERSSAFYDSFTYAPWMVANLTAEGFLTGSGAPLSWDNVFYNGQSVGYVHANQQDLEVYNDKRVLTLYWPLTQKEPVESRKDALKKTHAEWTEDVFREMEKAHRNIRTMTESVDIWVWGHGMIRPVPGFLWGGKRKEGIQSVNNSIFFAHSDLSGISVFEEAFYQGLRAAKEVLG